MWTNQASPLLLEPEGAKIVFQVRSRRPDSADFILAKLLDELFPPNELPGSNRGRYPGEKEGEICQAIAEGLAWLEAQGSLIPSPRPNGMNG